LALVLLIDDEVAVRRSIAAYLGRLGHEVHEATNGEVAIRLASERRFDLVITDVNMPKMDGIEVINALRRAESTAPVIVMSGGGIYPKELLLGSARALGAVSTLAKPFELEQLRMAVETALAGADPRTD